MRRRVQNQTLGHRGCKRDPLYKIRKLLLKGAERLDGVGVDRMLLETRLGDPDGDVLGAWCAKESVRDVYLTDDPAEAALLLDKAIEGCRTDWVDEIQSLGRTPPGGGQTTTTTPEGRKRHFRPFSGKPGTVAGDSDPDPARAHERSDQVHGDGQGRDATRACGARGGAHPNRIERQPPNAEPPSSPPTQSLAGMGVRTLTKEARTARQWHRHHAHRPGRAPAIYTTSKRLDPHEPLSADDHLTNQLAGDE